LGPTLKARSLVRIPSRFTSIFLIWSSCLLKIWFSLITVHPELLSLVKSKQKKNSQLEIHLTSLVTSDFCCSTPLFFLDFLDPSCFLPRVESSSSSSCHGQGQSGGQNLGFSLMGEEHRAITAWNPIRTRLFHPKSMSRWGSSWNISTVEIHQIKTRNMHETNVKCQPQMCKPCIV
jgi:hypothetical protein